MTTNFIKTTPYTNFTHEWVVSDFNYNEDDTTISTYTNLSFPSQRPCFSLKLVGNSVGLGKIKYLSLVLFESSLSKIKIDVVVSISKDIENPLIVSLPKFNQEIYSQKPIYFNNLIKMNDLKEFLTNHTLYIKTTIFLHYTFPLLSKVIVSHSNCKATRILTTNTIHFHFDKLAKFLSNARYETEVIHSRGKEYYLSFVFTHQIFNIGMGLKIVSKSKKRTYTFQYNLILMNVYEKKFRGIG